MSAVADYDRADQRSWYSLPPEIRLLLLDWIRLIYLDWGLRLSLLAAVCREWQRFFEQEMFRYLALTSADLHKFLLCVQGRGIARLDYIRNLRIGIRLKSYHGAERYKPETMGDKFEFDTPSTPCGPGQFALTGDSIPETNRDSRRL